MTQPKVCKECAHFRMRHPTNVVQPDEQNQFRLYGCTRETTTDIVTGEQHTLNCYEERHGYPFDDDDKDRCGTEGKYWRFRERP